MMDVQQAICLQDYLYEPQTIRVALKRGQEYTVGVPGPSDTRVSVFTTYWIKAPIGIFEPLRRTHD